MKNVIRQDEILFTGGSGLLGGEFRKLLPLILYPFSQEFNVTNYQQMDDYVKVRKISLIIHAAAFTSPPKIDRDPLRALETNIMGTANVVKLCMQRGIRLVYLSTDYVFRGDQGNYREEDPISPVNKYAWSKLGGECAVRMHENSLIIRTTFGPNVFPYEKAFTDQWTSRESVGVIAEKIAGLLDKNIRGVIHVGGPRRTVFEYAVSLDETRDIKPCSINDVNFAVPRDTSLDCEKYGIIKTERGGKSE